MYVKHTGQALSVIEDAMERDNFMTAEKAKEFGLIDDVVLTRPEDENADAGASAGGNDNG